MPIFCKQKRITNLSQKLVQELTRKRNKMTIKEINGKHYIESKVVLIETKVPTKDDLSFYSLVYLAKKKQYIHILSDEKPTEGDFVYDYAHDKVGKFNGLESEGGSFSDHSMKIIATTDSSLKLECQGCRFHRNNSGVIYTCSCQSFPKIPIDFIENFMESYNNGKIINDALVEVNLLCCQTGINCGFPCNGNCTEIAVPELKVDKNNVISIKKINDKWNDIFQEYLKENPAFDNAKVSFLSYLEDNFNPPTKK